MGGRRVGGVGAREREGGGDIRNGGREGRAKGEPEEVGKHDLVIPAWGRATPYFTARMPPAVGATLPPSDALFSPGHTGYTKPIGASAASS